MACSVARWLCCSWAFLVATFACLRPRRAPIAPLPPVPRPLSLPLFDASGTFTECLLGRLGPMPRSGPVGPVQAEQIQPAHWGRMKPYQERQQVMPLNMLKVQLASVIVRFPLLLAGLCASGLTLNLFSGMSARALTVTNSEVFSPVVLQVDGGFLDTGLLIEGLGNSVTNVSLSLSLTKCGGNVPISDSGVCNSSDFSFNREIQLFLKSPTGTFAQMVFQDDLSGQTPGATVTWNFQDSFLGYVSGDKLISGNYKPSPDRDPDPLLPPNSFALFTGEDPNGTWSLIYEDTTPGAPLSINSWSISVTDENGPGPGPTPADVPGPLPLFGLAAAFGWSRLLRKRIRARRDLRPGT